MPLKVIILSIFLCLGFRPVSGNASPRNYYISCSEGDDSNPGTLQAPWRTLEKLHLSWDQVGPGDSVLFSRGDLFAPSSVGDRKGLITIPNLKAGLSQAPIVLGAYGDGERPVISGENCSDYHQALRSGSLEYFVIRDLEFRGYVLFRAYDDLKKGIRHLKLLNLKLQGGKDPHSTTKIQFSNPYAPSRVPESNVAAPIDLVEIGYCEFLDTEGEDAVNIGSAGDSLWVHHNTWRNVSEEALDVAGGTGHLIEYNFVSGCSVNGMKFHSQFSNQFGITIRGNIINQAGVSATALILQNISHSKIYNNTVVSPYTCFFGNRDRLPPEAYYGDFFGNEVSNNIFIGVVQIGGEWEQADLGAGPWYTAPVHHILENNLFSNNIYWSLPDNTTLFRFWEGKPYPDPISGLNRSRTITSEEKTKFIRNWKRKAAASEKMKDPKLCNPYKKEGATPEDFSPNPNSPALHSGRKGPDYHHDFRGTILRPGKSPSIGAYQTAI